MIGLLGGARGIPRGSSVSLSCLGSLTSLFAATHFKIKTDVHALISPDLPWAQRARAYAKAFPEPPILALVDAPTSEFADQAAARLDAALAAHGSACGSGVGGRKKLFSGKRNLATLKENDLNLCYTSLGL